MHRNSIVRLLLATALCVPSTALAQRRRGHHRGNTPPQQQQQPAAGGGNEGGSDSGSMQFTTDETSQPAASPAPTDQTSTAPADQTAPAAGATDQGAAGGLGLEGIGGADVHATRHPIHEEVYAVQQIYALRNHRLEVQPTIGVSLNDPYVQHTGAGIAANFWVTNVLAAGVNFQWFQGLNQQTDLEFHVARSAHLVVPINEYQMEAALNLTYVPIYGKFLMFNQYIFHWDIYALAGIGFMRTRPIAVVDPEVRSFSYNTELMFDVGVGVRVFINRWLGIVGEIRNYIYPEQLEALAIGSPDAPVSQNQMPIRGSRQDPATWYGPSSLTDNVEVQLGICVFLPFGVTYHLLK